MNFFFFDLVELNQGVNLVVPEMYESKDVLI